MSNVLQVNHQEAIRSLQQKGWSKRRIARELGLHRNTVSRCVEPEAKCTDISVAGSEESEKLKCTSSTSKSIPGSPVSAEGKSDAKACAGAGRKSRCEPLAESIRAWMEAGLSAQRTYQDLVEECGFAGSYQSVKRFVRKLQEAQPERIWRMEAQPGEEMQVDFGLGTHR